MLSEPRTISLLTELIHIPAKHSVENLRQIYNTICGSCGYENFIRTPEGARVERTETEGPEVSTVTFRHDRLLVVEDNTTLTLDQYAKKLEAVAKTTMEILNLPFFLVQQATVRAIATPNCFKTAGEFIGKSLFRIRAEDLSPLGRPTNVFGLRLFFPATKELPHQFNVRIESYVKDPRSVYIENIGMFKTPIQYQKLETLGDNVEATADFVSAHLCPFLSQYDIKESDL